MYEIDLSFSSFFEWSRWFNENQDNAFVPDVADAVRQIRNDGFCEPITKKLFDKYSIADSGSLREGLLANGLNSRHRAVLRVLEEKIDTKEPLQWSIYSPEAITPFAAFMRGIFPRFLGTEYFADASGSNNFFPILHADLTNLDFQDASFDVVISNEVLEHVPSIEQALAESARILKFGGWHIGTFPFLFNGAVSEVRTVRTEGSVVHLLPPEYHGNPVDESGGSLVYTIPGWDIIEKAKENGFSRAEMRFIADSKYGILTENVGVFIFCAQK